MTETTAAVEQMIANIRNVTSIAETRQSAARVLVEAADTGGVQVEQTNEAVKEASALVTNICDISGAVREIDDLASHVSNGLREVRDALRELDEAMSELSVQSDANRENGAVMEEGLSAFTV